MSDERKPHYCRVQWTPPDSGKPSIARRHLEEVTAKRIARNLNKDKGAKVYYLDENDTCFKVWDAGTDTAVDVDWKLTDEPVDQVLKVQDASTGSKSKVL